MKDYGQFKPYSIPAEQVAIEYFVDTFWERNFRGDYVPPRVENILWYHADRADDNYAKPWGRQAVPYYKSGHLYFVERDVTPRVIVSLHQQRDKGIDFQYYHFTADAKYNGRTYDKACFEWKLKKNGEYYSKSHAKYIIHVMGKTSFVQAFPQELVLNLVNKERVHEKGFGEVKGTDDGRHLFLIEPDLLNELCLGYVFGNCVSRDET